MLIFNFSKTPFIFFFSEHCVTSKRDAHFQMEAVLCSLFDELTTWGFVIKKNCGKYIPMVVGLQNAIPWTCNSV